MSRRAASPATVAARTAVDRALADVVAGATVLVACSGGPDSLALAGAAAWVGRRRGVAVRGIVVDHGLQPGSAEVAAAAAAACLDLGLVGVDVVAVDVGSAGGPEAAARAARYRALDEAATRQDAVAVLLGHTREDQAETVLLRLTRGSGARSLAAMAERTGRYRRPLLRLPRDVVHAAAADMLAPLSRTPWRDPHNDDRGFARVRVRTLLDALAADLGPGVVLSLSRTADLLRDDADALDAWADEAAQRLVTWADGTVSAGCPDLHELPRAVRTRVVRQMCQRAGCPADALDFDHVTSVDALVADWRGQGDVRLPGGVVAMRRYGRLCVRSC